MRLVILTEDSKSLYKLLKVWLNYIDDKFQRVDSLLELNTVDYGYFITFGSDATGGDKKLCTHTIYNLVTDITLAGVQVDRVVVFMDTDEKTVQESERLVRMAVNKTNTTLPFDILLCNRCVETWLLGNAAIYPNSPTGLSAELQGYINNYNIARDDPEYMPDSDGVIKPGISKYHFGYLHALTLAVAPHNQYRKNKLGITSEPDYFNNLLHRIDTSEHIATFRQFIEYFENLLSVTHTTSGLIPFPDNYTVKYFEFCKHNMDFNISSESEPEPVTTTNYFK